MTQFDLQDELGKGFYGTVRKVLHKPTNVLMAMKVPFRSPSLQPPTRPHTPEQEIRLQLEQQQLNAILMELDVLHRSICPEIVDFYGAFFIESCVYYCMEYMDAGSLDRLEGVGVPEDVLARIASAMVRGLKFLKDNLQVIHRGAPSAAPLSNFRALILPHNT
jgi:mitogen-activated protein kinase kinase